MIYNKKWDDLSLLDKTEMLAQQVKQGNQPNAEVFIKNISANRIIGGFNWDKSEKGHGYYASLLLTEDCGTGEPYAEDKSNSQIKSNSMYKQWHELPKEIQEKMLDEQVKQGNPRNKKIFIEQIDAPKSIEGFDWDLSKIPNIDMKDTFSSENFWSIALGGNFDLFYKHFPKKEGVKPNRRYNKQIKIIDQLNKSHKKIKEGLSKHYGLPYTSKESKEVNSLDVNIDKFDNDKSMRKRLTIDEIANPHKVLVKSIDNVTPGILDVVLRLVGVQIPLDVLDKIIDVVEQLEIHGGKFTIDDICKLEIEWRGGAIKE